MRFSSTLLTAAIAVVPVFSAPAALVNRQNTCTNPTIRKSWTNLSADQKEAYMGAVLCLLNAPAKTTNPGVVTRYDDLVVAHQLNADAFGAQTDTWHTTGQFLHIHRFFMHAHETLLRDECGYTGPMAYWDEPKDAGAFSQSSVVADFGGPGNADGTVIEGPFANITFNVGPGSTNTPHLLTRKISDSATIGTGQSYIDVVNAETSFASFMAVLNALPSSLHADGHIGMGGDMADILTSPNDPMFFLHHSHVDAIWARWQGIDASRISDIAGAGNETQAEPATGYVATNAATVLYMYDIIPTATVADVANTQGGILCYKYEDA